MTDTQIERARFNMVEQQIRPWDVTSLTVLDTLTKVPREDFVPEQYKSMAFSDIEIPLSNGQFMMHPRVEGRVLQALDVQPTDTALEIGTGSGYLTACLSTLASHVDTVELHKSLSESAKKRLNENGFNNIDFSVADASQGRSEKTQYDVIAVTGSIPKYHAGFEKCLKVGGRLFIVVGRAPVMEAMVVTRVREDVWDKETLFETELAALENTDGKPEFVL